MKLLYKKSNKIGIYIIKNTHTNRVYVGQAGDIRKRWSDHKKRLLKNKHHNKFLQRDFNKCFKELNNDDFIEFHILEIMENSTKVP